MLTNEHVRKLYSFSDNTDLATMALVAGKLAGFNVQRVVPTQFSRRYSFLAFLSGAFHSTVRHFPEREREWVRVKSRDFERDASSGEPSSKRGRGFLFIGEEKAKKKNSKKNKPRSDTCALPVFRRASCTKYEISFFHKRKMLARDDIIQTPV